MEQPTSQADHLKVWQLRLRSLEANAEELAALAAGREKLQSIESRAQSAFRAQSAAAAAKQEASKELEALIAEGRLVMAFLNAGLRQHYGKESEKLAEFQLLPYRGRNLKAAGEKGARRKKGARARSAGAEAALGESADTEAVAPAPSSPPPPSLPEEAR